MKIILISLIVVSVCSFSMSGLLRHELADHEAAFINWINQNEANYLTVDELNFRKAVFAENKASVETLNGDANQTANFAMNQFADRTKAERNMMNGYIPKSSEQTALAKSVSEAEATTLLWYVPADSTGSSYYVKSAPPSPYVSPFSTGTPLASVDWRSSSNPAVLTPVKDQGACGSCWAFAATLVLESNIAIAKKTEPVRTSEQEYVDCVKGACAGCNGGDSGWAWIYTNNHNGQLYYTDYPYTDNSYTNGVTGTCSLPAGKTRTPLKP